MKKPQKNHCTFAELFAVSDTVGQLKNIPAEVIQVQGSLVTPSLSNHTQLIQLDDRVATVILALTQSTHYMRSLPSSGNELTALPPVVNLMVKVTPTDRKDSQHDQVEVHILDFARREIYPLLMGKEGDVHILVESASKSRFKNGIVGPGSNAFDLIITVNRALLELTRSIQTDGELERVAANAAAPSLRPQDILAQRHAGETELEIQKGGGEGGERQVPGTVATLEALKTPWIPSQGQHVYVEGVNGLCTLQDYDEVDDIFYCSLADSTRQQRSIVNRGRNLDSPVPRKLSMDENGWFAVKPEDIKPRFLFA